VVWEIPPSAVVRLAFGMTAVFVIVLGI
jgi:hypothetical protein